MEKQVCLTINQVVSGTQQRILQLERCFGVLVCPGRNVKKSDMQLLDMVSCYYIKIVYKNTFVYINYWPNIGIYGN